MMTRPGVEALMFRSEQSQVLACYCPSEGHDHVVLTVSLPKRMSTYGMASIICFL